MDDNASLAHLGRTGEVVELEVTERALQLKWEAKQKRYRLPLHLDPSRILAPRTDLLPQEVYPLEGFGINKLYFDRTALL